MEGTGILETHCRGQGWLWFKSKWISGFKSQFWTRRIRFKSIISHSGQLISNFYWILGKYTYLQVYFTRFYDGQCFPLHLEVLTEVPGLWPLGSIIMVNEALQEPAPIGGIRFLSSIARIDFHTLAFDFHPSAIPEGTNRMHVYAEEKIN